MKTIIKDEKLKITYDMRLVIRGIISDCDFLSSRKRLLNLLGSGHIDYVELMKIRNEWYRKRKEIQKLL